ncbi:MAG TPA: hypothetical protein PLL69_09005, partial [Gemmatimonadales bacterium]|nr:hypothetical protein [Gemmatimonadales bacterium]
RASGTEPVIRVMAEGEDRALVEAMVDDIVAALGGPADIGDLPDELYSAMFVVSSGGTIRVHYGMR